MASLDQGRCSSLLETLWEDSIIPTLCDYIRIPNKSPHFDPDWAANGHMEAAVQLLESWARAHALPGMQTRVVRLEGRTPVLFIEVPGTLDSTVLLYGHLDKQPEMTGWDPDLDPWQPVRRGERLYGRGGADDGYALFGSLGAIHALQDQGLPHGRLLLLIEACEESGSYDLPFYMTALAEQIGQPELVVCLDSGCGNYEQLWLTTSLRGMASGVLDVQVLEQGVHSGDATGIVPSSFRIARQLLERLENAETGEIRWSELHCDIPQQRRTQAEDAAAILQEQVYSKFPFVSGAGPESNAVSQLILQRTWQPGLEIIAAEGIPALAEGGNVMRPSTSLKLSLRLPPRVSATAATALLKERLESAPPAGVRVTFIADQAADGWDAPPLAGWLEEALQQASMNYFDRSVKFMGEGGSIPFMQMLADRFPAAQFVITGVLGPASNAHGPNEFLHLEYAKHLTACIAEILAAAGKNHA